MIRCWVGDDPSADGMDLGVRVAPGPSPAELVTMTNPQRDRRQWTVWASSAAISRKAGHAPPHRRQGRDQAGRSVRVDRQEVVPSVLLFPVSAGRPADQFTGPLVGPEPGLADVA